MISISESSNSTWGKETTRWIIRIRESSNSTRGKVTKRWIIRIGSIWETSSIWENYPKGESLD